MTLAIDSTSYRSPNYDARPAPPFAIVLHSGEGTKHGDLATLTNDRVAPLNRVSAHYYVDRLGTVYQLVHPDRRAWHAGVSNYLTRSNWNDFSIGVETEHMRGQSWPAVQRAALAELFASLIARYHIAQPFVAAHRWIAPLRKSDPTDWPDAELKPWIAALYAPPPAPLVLPSRAYRVRGVPVYERRDCTGPIVVYLNPGNTVDIDLTYPEGTAHLASGAGFVRMDDIELIQG